MHCDKCADNRCKMPGENFAASCPGGDRELIREAERLINLDENRFLFRAAAQVEQEGYGRWPRVREAAELMKKLGVSRVGLAFCTGLKEEAGVFSDIMRAHGVETAACMCKMGSVPKEEMGIPDEEKVRPGTYEVICNPVAQALYLNEKAPDYHFILGLCVGHDALFAKYSKAPVSTVVAKDRALANNPAGALYCAKKYCSAVWPEE